VRGDVAAGLQIGEEPRDDRQPARHHARRHPSRDLSVLDRLHTLKAVAAGALGGDEPEHIRAPTSAGGLSTIAKKTRKSEAAASTVFGRHRPSRNSR